MYFIALIKNRGYSLVEMMVVVSIVVILLSIAIPSFQDDFRRQRITGLSDNLHFLMRLAKAQAAKQNTDIFVVFKVDSADSSQWCVGLSDSNINCNCNVQNSCTAENVERILESADFSGVRLLTDKSALTVAAHLGRSQDLTIHISYGDKDAKLKHNAMGLDIICSPSGSLVRYPKC
ncbi:Tfp pilus assembly protein FimT/FimU [Psychrobium sp. 1_MG-2023]|uniref:pilus assembly FimT family protein n=1 Tax=Psychrobium sp. 1_MG-2023 TaxID=3062624 RepID=UPI002688D7B6|nr:GspH/FimT family pseudopilin [Psychrobium sp. 1_MG-2023]MDP2559640.1 prepilin-type N-terminal cleavage/methylation domain-containing protein [Psychrobium sp. 1_MG-2023]